MQPTEYRAASVDELAEGQMKSFQADGKTILLAKVNGQFVALAGLCPHYGAPLAEGLLHDGRIVCPWHHAVFSAHNGNLIHPPALDALPRFEVRVRGRDVYVLVPADAPKHRPMPMSAYDPARDLRTFAVIGTGAAAAAAVEVLRQEGFAGRLIMIGPERHPPYDRPNCSKGYLAGKATADWMPLRPAAFYDEHGIERWSKTVSRLDVPTTAMEFDDASRFVPDAVLIATGARARPLEVSGADRRHVFLLRTWDDTELIIEAAQTARTAVVIGSSFIGMEVASSLRQRGLDVSVISRDAVPFQRTLGEPVGRILLDLHQRQGVHFHLGRTVARILGQSAVEGVVLDDGERVPAELVVAGLGVRLNTDFIAGAALNEDASLTVDEHFRFAPGIYAAGDIARYPEPHLGQAVRIEHWRLAQQQGRAAARAMLGRTEPFDAVPFFWTRQYNLSVAYVGWASSWDELLMTGDPAKADFTAFYILGGKAVAAVGTQESQLMTFEELFRLGRLPTTASLRQQPTPDLRTMLTN